jgi:hypothetical protein
MPPVEPSKDNLATINAHFWDWISWLATKEAGGRHDLVLEHLPQLFGHLLQAMEAGRMPEGLHEAMQAFVARRDALELEYGTAVSRTLEREIRRGIHRIHGTVQAHGRLDGQPDALS